MFLTTLFGKKPVAAPATGSDETILVVPPGTHKESIAGKSVEIRPGVTVLGRVSAERWAKICGKVEGDVGAATVYVYENAIVKGDIECEEIFLYPDSCVIGNVKANRSHICPQSKVIGSVDSKHQVPFVSGGIVKRDKSSGKGS